MTCIICPKGCSLKIDLTGEQYTVSGYRCLKGKDYALQEVTNPLRSLQSTVRTTLPGQRRAAVRTSTEVPLKDIFRYMEEINRVVLNEKRVCGDIIAYGLCGTDVNLILTERLK